MRQVQCSVRRRLCQAKLRIECAFRRWCCVVLLAGLLHVGQSVGAAEDPGKSGDAAVAILQRRCINCHGVGEQAGDLRLDSAEHFQAAGGRGGLLVRLEDGAVSSASLILRTITGADPDLAMPPEDPLPDSERRVLQEWIMAGAVWPADKPVVPGLGGSNAAAAAAFYYDDVWQRDDHPIRQVFADERWEHWAWKPRQVVAPPQTMRKDWAFNPVDQFLLAEWESLGLAPAQDVDRRQWLRRLSFDLIGLPPTYAEMQEFLLDTSPQAFERQIERLLQHPGYGEQVGRMWLDVVRYSDSNGFDWDEFRPQAWRYRDYVVAAFNDDMRFDRFIREQLAGDEISAGPPHDGAAQAALLGTGYLRMGPHDNAASLFNEQDRSRDELLTDLVETTGSAFLGLTLSCCRCHDHKTDALLQADHFRLRAFFAAVRFADDVPIDLADQQAEIESRRVELQAEMAVLEKGETADEEATKQLIAGLKAQLPGFTYAMLMRDGAEVPVTTILAQGDYRKPLSPVEPGFPVLWNPYDAKVEKAIGQDSSGRRTALADWMTHPENPLTARVIVNRLWQANFGIGLVATPNDFGVTGAAPSNVALLDWLAEELVRSNWSVKHIQRLLVGSHAYRQRAIAAGPQGQACGSPRRELKRLTAEQLRDAVLCVSDQLLPSKGGPPIWPQLPAEILQANPAFLDDNETKTKGWYPSPPEQQAVRSIYLVQKRTVSIPLLETFDLPDNSVSCGCRQQSLVAPQALALLNGDLMETAAESLVSRLSPEGSSEEHVRNLYRWVLQREPTEGEIRVCQTFRQSHDWVQLARVLLNLNEFMFLD